MNNLWDTPLVLRNAIVPTASLGSGLGYILIMAGLFLQWTGLAMIGLICSITPG